MKCIPKHLINEFLGRLKSGEITPEKLLDMTSAERREYFSSFLGDENAKDVNALFESKMILKSQKEGIVKWAKEVSGITPQARRDILSRVEKMDKILTPENENAFLEDLVAHRLGTTVTMEEAANIASLAKETARLKAEIDQTKKNIIDETPEERNKRLEFGRASVEFQEYVSGLKEKAQEKSIKEWVMPRNWGEAFVGIAGLAKSLKASFDNSVIGRQGIKTLFTEPDIWAKNSAQSFKDWADSLKGVDVMKEVRADVLSRPNALNGLYKQEGLAVGVKEEAYPESAWGKMPVLGKIFKASESAFTAWQYRTRADVFDRMVDIADKTGADVKGLGKFVNSLTGRGSLGVAEKGANVFNNLFFSPRFVKSNFDTLTGHLFSKDMAPLARKKAAESTAKTVFGIAAVLAISKAINPDSVELDPRSSDFGKIKIGHTRFDISGGMSSLVVLASRILTMSSKSTTTGTVSKLNTGKYGSKTGLDVILDFLGGKLSPTAGIFRDIAKGEDFQGNKVTLGGEAVNLLAPLPITNAIELYNDPKSAPIIAALVADGLGIGTNTYGKEVKWNADDSKVLSAFKKQVGEKRFKQANKEFNKRFNERIDKITLSKEYQRLSDDDKMNMISDEKKQIKDRLLREYGFRYRPERIKKLPTIK